MVRQGEEKDSSQLVPAYSVIRTLDIPGGGHIVPVV
jgi:hypothetical protein